ncbi:MAG: gamma-glutamyl-phosphate reductase, partial [Oscillospiraceae bacterium]|nr:gamma-glutamyl-phosphate reductase [Oscillospiraceae bacterium]
MLIEIGNRARAASRILSGKSAADKNKALLLAASALEENAEMIMAQNAVDVEAGKKNNLPSAFIDRLSLTSAVIAGIARGIREVARLPDPVGRILSESVIKDGFRLVKVSVPIGVIAVIYEARPNV